MAITNTWSVTNMQHTDADGGVFLVYWSMVAASDGTPSYTASEGGKLRCEYDASSSSYIAYADLTEANVLGWVYNSLIEGEETAEEAKARIEADRTGKVQGQIDRAASQSSGVPWQMTLVFALIVLVNGEVDTKATSHWYSITRCNYFVTQLTNPPVQAYCVPKFIELNSVEVYR